MARKLPMRTEEFLEFESAEEMRRWLAKNHASSKGIWVRIYKKGTGVPTVKIADALEEVLCYGWITGQARPLDEESWLARYVPRRPKSTWSKINVGIAEKLIEQGRMRAAGMKAIEAARSDGRWARAYNPPSKATLPPDFLRELDKNAKAKRFLKTINRANFYAIVFRLENSKSEEKRRALIKTIIEMLENGRTFH